MVIVDEIAKYLRQVTSSGDENVRRMAQAVPVFLGNLFEVASDPTNRVSVIITLAASTLTRQEIGLSGEPLSAGEPLAVPEDTPSPAATATATPRRKQKPKPKRTPTATSTPQRNAIPTATAPPPVATIDDDNSGSGSDSSGHGRGRGRGRGGDDDD